MKKIVVAIMGTISGLVMLFSYHTSTQGVAAASPEETDSGSTQSDADSTTAPSAATGSTASSGTTPAASPTVAASGADGTYTGDAVETRWGTVQVEITVANGKITNADAVQYPTG